MLIPVMGSHALPVEISLEQGKFNRPAIRGMASCNL